VGYISGELFRNSSGTDVVIFKIFSPKNSKKLAFLTHSKAKLCKIVIITLVFEKNANIFAENCQKSQKIVIITSNPGLPGQSSTYVHTYLIWSAFFSRLPTFFCKHETGFWREGKSLQNFCEPKHKFIQPGTDVMILKIFSPKKSAKKLPFLTQNKAKLCIILILTLVFEKNANFFAECCQKSQKIVIITSTPAPVNLCSPPPRAILSQNVA
jgi:hypothetical protein